MSGESNHRIGRLCRLLICCSMFGRIGLVVGLGCRVVVVVDGGFLLCGDVCLGEDDSSLLARRSRMLYSSLLLLMSSLFEEQEQL